MALFWRSGSLQSHKKKFQVIVPAVEMNQPLNPYTEIQVFTEHTDIVRHLLQVNSVFNAAARCVSSADDCTAVLWDIESASKLFVFVGHSRPISCMLLLPRENSGQYLLTGSSDKTLRVWDLENGECVEIITEHASTVKCLVSVPSCNLFCSGGSELCLWDLDWKIVQRVTPIEDVDINHMIVVLSNRLVLSVGADLIVYKVISTCKEDGSYKYNLQVFKNDLPSHRETIRCLVNISDSCFGSASLDGTICIWATRALNCTQEFHKIEEYKEHCNFPYSVQYLLPIQERYLFAAINNGFAVYDVFTGNCLAQIQNAHFSSITALSMVYEGEFLASCSEDGTIRLWGSRVKVDSDQDSNIHRQLSNFFGTHKHGRHIYQPSLLGECVAHSGAVNFMIDYGQEGLVSCGADSLLIMWKDGIRQSCKRSNLIRENLQTNLFNSVLS